ncbi:hypothetical protein JHL17_34150 [Azospirillum sp. YIM B02556]|uniref:Uncharacterized protein n=1 Tax=Azospirillum endophyticum TaxID=2800326 RepID=A0ABS1FG80_9PROT|nr:hypothetical protein [Azospirillum endophyticum]MBK1842450.1 hypothetical protein [Azospirillum endophyticum]
MPDTHLAMPRTLSAPYAELLEADAPRTKTTSDAPPNGTAAAAAAFARLLASGDQAMQPETSTITDIHPHKSSAFDGVHRPQGLRAMLLGSTTIPALGMTIAEASQRTADLLAENDGPGPLTDEQAEALAARWSVLESAVVGSVPQTILDAASILDRIFPDDATHIPHRDIPAVRRVATFLHQIVEAARSASPNETSIIPSIGMTFRQAADRVREMVERANNSPRGEDDGIEDKAELERREAARIADCHEWCRIIDAMMATPAQTMGDLFAKLERIACPSLGIRHLVFADEEIALLDEDVQRLQPLWSGPHLAARAGEPLQDASIFAAYSRWSQLVRDCYAATTDEDCDRLSDQADEAALDVMTHEPATREGLAAQVFVMLHLAHGGSTADHLDIDFSALSGGDGPDSAAVQALVERVKRIGRRDGEETPQGALTSLYARWVEVRARYLADDEGDTLRAELDQIEDRLEAEPVRCVADAIAKPGYFLTASNSMLDDGILPSIDADGSAAWPRLLLTVEDAAELLAVDAQAPFRAMVAGLRQLMQRHVKLEEEAERRAEAYQIPEQVALAMQTVCVRNRVASAEEDVRAPDHAQGQREEALTLLHALKPESRKSLLSFMRFLPVSSHLHEAMLDFAREHGMAPHYRQWLEGHLADLGDTSGVAIAGDRLRQAWKDLHTLDIECVPDDLDDRAACDAYNRSVAEACKRLLAVPVQTVGDVAILARFALRGVTIHWGADETIAQELDAKGQPPEDRGEQLMVALWRVVEHLTRQQHIATQLAPVFQQDDDADLLKAFDEWLIAARSLDAIPIEASEEEREPYEQRDEDAVGRLLEFSPKTPRGTAAILRYLFLRSAGTVEAERTVLHGGEPNGEDLADLLPQVLWQLIKALEALPAAANDLHQEPDAFAETVAAFEAEAPATLALPLEPTGRMVDAAASAAGITPAQFQAAYAAAVEALKLERAA